MSLGEATLVLTWLAAGFLAADRVGEGTVRRLVTGLLSGAGAGAALSLLVLVGDVVNLRAVLLQASTELYSLLTLGMGVAGFWVPTVLGAVFGLIGGAVRLAPVNLRRSLIVGLLAVVVMGVFGGLLGTMMLAIGLGELARVIFGITSGVTVVGAIVTVAAVVAWDLGARLGAPAECSPRRTDQVASSEAVVGGISLGFVGSAMDSFGTFLFGATFALIGAAIGLTVGALIGAGIQRGLRALHIGDRVAALPVQSQRRVNLASRTAADLPRRPARLLVAG